MKKFRIVFIMILVCKFAPFSFAGDDKTTYQFQDTLNVKVNENVRLMIISENLYHFQPGDSIDKLIAQFNKDILKIEYPEIDESYVRIYYHVGPFGSSTIKFEDVTERDKNYQVLQNGETLSPMPIELVMNINKANRASIYLSGPELFEDLNSYKFGDMVSGILETAKEEEPSMRRKQLTLNWILDDGEGNGEFHEINIDPKSYDMISFSGTVAASLVRDKLVPSVDLQLGVMIGKKTLLRHMIKAEASMLYIFNQDPEGQYSTDINTFLGVSYFLNPSKNPDKPRWFGVGLSYLVWRNGSFFDENTFRFTVGARFGKHFSAMPELYISDGFKKVMPGLRLQLSL
nr:hypothetical protein [Bacteroidota bacterium]